MGALKGLLMTMLAVIVALFVYNKFLKSMLGAA